MSPGEESARASRFRLGCGKAESQANHDLPFLSGRIQKNPKQPEGERENDVAKPNISLTDSDGLRVVKFEIPGGVTTPAEAAEAVGEVEKQIPGDLPVLLNGRGPVWMYAMLAHAAHPTPVVATFDPRLGYVVVATHSEQYVVGQVIPGPKV